MYIEKLLSIYCYSYTQVEEQRPCSAVRIFITTADAPAMDCCVCDCVCVTVCLCVCVTVCVLSVLSVFSMSVWRDCNCVTV